MKKRKQLMRRVVLDIICGREKVQYEPNRFPHLLAGVTEVMIRRKVEPPKDRMPYDMYPELSDEDKDLVREVFWDLVIERVITIGLNASNPDFPWFKLHSEYKWN
jgi:hypothetical protein